MYKYERQQNGNKATQLKEKNKHKYEKRKIQLKRKKQTENLSAKNIKRLRIKWKRLQHNGPFFAPKYEPLPHKVYFKYNQKRIKLNQKAEEIATFYAKMLDNKYVKKTKFNENFMRDWREHMTPKEKKIILDINKCDFQAIHRYIINKDAAKKLLTKKQKLAEKKKKEKISKKYGWCYVNGRKEKVENFRVPPPGLFIGRGNHPKMGTLRKRINPEDVSLNLGKGAVIPKPSISGKWKEIVHNNTVTWLACWYNDIVNCYRYVLLNPSSKVRGKREIRKYEIARALHKHIKHIRKDYMKGMSSNYPVNRQTSVALLFIDRLSLRIGNEKGKDTADTVGCCSLRKEHIKLNKHSKNYFVRLAFKSKDSMVYHNEIQIELSVYKAIQKMLKDKRNKSKLFDEISPTSLNVYLNRIMKGLSAKVFRTYNASKLFETLLKLFTRPKMGHIDKIRAYEMANRHVAILCNHRRIPSKNFDKRTKKLSLQIRQKLKLVKLLKHQLTQHDDSNKSIPYVRRHSAKQMKFDCHNEKLHKLLNLREKHQLDKHISLATSKLNYCDPRISVAWCKKHNININEIYSTSQRERFEWAIKTTKPNFKF